jgi:hypothetical protein
MGVHNIGLAKLDRDCVFLKRGRNCSSFHFARAKQIQLDRNLHEEDEPNRLDACGCIPVSVVARGLAEMLSPSLLKLRTGQRGRLRTPDDGPQRPAAAFTPNNSRVPASSKSRSSISARLYAERRESVGLAAGTMPRPLWRDWEDGQTAGRMRAPPTEAQIAGRAAAAAPEYA